MNRDQRLMVLCLGLMLLFPSMLRGNVAPHLERVGEYGRGKRLAGGYMLGLAAIGFGTGAYVAAKSDSPSARENGAWILGATGGLFALGSAVCFLFPADFEKLPQEFDALSVTTAMQRERRERIGQQYLLRLRDQARTHRLIGGSMALAFGLAEAIAFAVTGGNSADSWLLYSGAALIGVGGFSLAWFQSVPEKAYDAYQQGQPQSRVDWDLQLQLADRGGRLAVQLNF